MNNWYRIVGVWAGRLRSKDRGRWHMPQKILPVQAVAPQEVAVAGRSVKTSNIISLITNAFDTAAYARLYRDLR